MLPPSLQLAAPRALALTSPHIKAATAVTLAPTAYKLALELSTSRTNPQFQLDRHRSFHWWCRRSPSRRYASWGRHNPIDGTGQRPPSENQHEKEEDGYVLSPAERLWKAKMEVMEKMMRTDAYDGLFGSSNRMLRGLDWRDNGWRKLWQDQWKDMEKMSGDMREEVRSTLRTLRRDMLYTDSEAAARQAKENDKVKEELARAGWEYDAISNKMVPTQSEDRAGTSMPGRKEERRDGFVEIPVKPYTERSSATGESMPGRSDEVRAGFADIPVKTFKPKVEICSKEAAPSDTQDIQSKASADAPSHGSRRIPVPTVVAETESWSGSDHAALSKLPKDDIDLLTADDVRARMGHMKSPSRETTEQKMHKRAGLETRFKETQERARFIESELANFRAQQHELAETQTGAIAEHPTHQKPTDLHDSSGRSLKEQWVLQREQLKEAAADFQLRERKARKEIRELQQLHQNVNSRLEGLKGRSNGLVRSGLLSPKHAVQLGAASAALPADTKVLSKASALLAAAVQVAPKAPQAQAQAAGYVEPSLDRYAWDKKPFAKIRDAEELLQNVRDSLRNADEAIKAAEVKLEKSVRLAGSLNAEVEEQRQAMRGHEEKWRWRKDTSPSADTAAPLAQQQQPGHSELTEQIRGIYEDEYGAITAEHRQRQPPRELEEEEELAAMSLGGIPEISPASLDGGVAPEPVRSLPVSPHPEAFSGTPSEPAQANGAIGADEVTYTILALDPAMGLVTKATTSSTAKSDREEPIPLADALRKVAQPAMFISYLPELRRQGFEPISSSENLMVLKKIGGRTSSIAGAEPQERSSNDVVPSANGTSEIPELQVEPERAANSTTWQTQAAADTKATDEADNSTSYYSTRLQSPTSSTFQGLKPRKVEPVFSGKQGGHANYERLRHHIRHATRERKLRRRRARRGFRKAASTVLTIAAACYIAGVVSEWVRNFGEAWADAPRIARELEEEERNRN